MKLADIRDRALRNPAVWILFVLFLLVGYWNYQKAKDLNRMCELTAEFRDVANPTPAQQELTNICLSRADSYLQE
jgi:hypothetical protein